MTDNIDILLKLFDTLKESSEKNEDATKQLIMQQLELVSHIKNLPIEDLREALKEHAKQSSKIMEECTEPIKTKTDKILDKVNVIENKISKMILIVIVVTGLFSAALLFGNLVKDTNYLEKHQETYHKKK